MTTFNYNCENCKREREEYSIRFCTDCYNNGGAEIDQRIADAATLIFDCETKEDLKIMAWVLLIANHTLSFYEWHEIRKMLTNRYNEIN